MSDKMFCASLTRIADLEDVAFDTIAVERGSWGDGDYVVGRAVVASGGLAQVELTTGRMAKIVPGDVVVGALGTRYATLEAVGSWQDVGEDRRMDLLTSAGLIGRATSVARNLPPLVSLEYLGHAQRGGKRLRMQDYVQDIPPGNAYDCPTILIVGTSMSAGKTVSATVIVRRLKKLGLRVVGAKLTGAGRYRDILSMADAGADAIFDFVDVGFPSSVCPVEEYRVRLRGLLAMISASKPDVVVAEAGASPLEPYNGDTVLEELREKLKAVVLCASDPYAVVGVMEGFKLRADLIGGLATSTAAGIELIEKLTGIQALNFLDAASVPQLDEFLRAKLKV